MTRGQFPSDLERYRAIRDRDPRAEGCFYYAVTTTGVYCRPTCAARPALRKNVVFYATADDAERAGFRACKRCRPRELSRTEQHAKIVETTRAKLDAADRVIGLADLAIEAGLSPHYLQRLFKRYLGMTPREYAAAVRLQRLGRELRDGSSVTSAIYRAGYSSGSRLYEAESGALGMLPSGVRKRGEGTEMNAIAKPCSLGYVLVAATPRGVCAILLGDDSKSLFAELHQRFANAEIHTDGKTIAPLAAKIVAMIDSSAVSSSLQLDLIGTAFQQRVWRALRDIPRGETVTYGELAQRIGSPSARRAVGTACGKNPVAVVVPCHRVVRGDGSLGGYHWGLWRKEALLDRERNAESPSRSNRKRGRTQ